VLSVWAAAVLWLAVARYVRDQSLVVPYTVVFATHLAIFGVSRLAQQFADRGLVTLGVRAVATGWALVMVPLAACLRLQGPALGVIVSSIAAIAAGTAVFVATEPGIRVTPQTARRWLSQAGAAAGASGLAWLAGTWTTSMLE
jgi:ABC-type uncharacterized transport system permease subunit